MLKCKFVTETIAEYPPAPRLFSRSTGPKRMALTTRPPILDRTFCPRPSPEYVVLVQIDPLPSLFGGQTTQIDFYIAPLYLFVSRVREDFRTSQQQTT
jgi:hypothetical protein